jgi:hypothetical protein
VPLRVLLLLFAAWGAGAQPAAGDPYGYPVADPLLATVAGTPEELRADLDIDPDYAVLGVKVFPDRKLRDQDYVWYLDKFRYLLLEQEGPAPLAFVIGGTGSGYSGARINVLNALLYKAGFHVVALPNPTSMSFVVTASRLGVPGLPWEDGADLLNVMKLAWERQLSRRLEVEGFYIAGYSLGATHAAWVSWLDEQDPFFDFRRVLMINPAVNLYRSVSVLDSYMDLFEDQAEVAALWDGLLDRLATAYAGRHGISFSEDFLYQALMSQRPPDEDLAKLIGLVFRISAQSMIVAADRVTRFGFIIPPNARADITDDVDPAFLVSAQTGFSTYFDQMLVPFFGMRDPDLTRDRLIRDAGLAPLEEYLRASPKIGLMHNADDPILGDGEADWLKDVFGDRAVIWPRGGHCGNMAYRDNVDWATRFITGAPR